MIIFYNKKTGEIFGVEHGRVHENAKKSLVKPSNVKRNDVGRYIVPMKTKYEMREQPIKEFRLVDKKTMRVEKVVVGKKKVKAGVELVPDVPFAKLISDFESRKKNIYDYKIKLKDGEVTGFVKKQA